MAHEQVRKDQAASHEPSRFVGDDVRSRDLRPGTPYVVRYSVLRFMYHEQVRQDEGASHEPYV